MSHQPNGGGEDGNGGASHTAQEQQYELLGFIQILSFAADPPSVTPFQPTTLSWSLRIPQTLHVPVSILVGGHKSIGPTGSATVTPFATTQYGMAAETLIVSRVIGALTVVVDDSECRSKTIPADTIALVLEDATKQALGGSSEFSLTGDGVTVTVDPGVITIRVSLSISVPDWFDPTMNITATIHVGPAGVVPNMSLDVETASVDVNIDQAWYSEALSLGISAGIADIVEVVSQVFLRQIVDAQVTPQIASGIQDQIDGFLKDAHDTDPQHRTFALTQLSLGSDGVELSACPLPPPPEPPEPPQTEPIAGHLDVAEQIE
jgi:hypothetical protein